MYLRNGKYYEYDTPTFLRILNDDIFEEYHYRKEHLGNWWQSFKLYKKSEKKWLKDLVAHEKGEVVYGTLKLKEDVK